MKRAIPPAWSPPLFPILLALVCVAIAFAGSEAQLKLRYERVAIGNGEFWRLISAHVAHLGWSHLWLNLAGLVLIWMLVGRAFSLVGWVIIFLAVAIGTSAGLWFFEPELQWYVGLSGVLHGLLVAGAFSLIGKYRDAPLLLGLVALKLVWEQWSGPMPGSEAAAGGPVVVSAHLYGAVSGMIAYLSIWLWRRFFMAK